MLPVEFLLAVVFSIYICVLAIFGFKKLEDSYSYLEKFEKKSQGVDLIIAVKSDECPDDKEIVLNAIKKNQEKKEIISGRSIYYLMSMITGKGIEGYKSPNGEYIIRDIDSPKEFLTEKEAYDELYKIVEKCYDKKQEFYILLIRKNLHS